jgi:hypothetical protein
MHFILDPFRRDAALFEMFYSLSGLRYSARRAAKPLLRKAGHSRCSSPQIVSKPLLFRAAIGNAVAIQSHAAPRRCYAPQYASVAKRSNAQPLLHTALRSNAQPLPRRSARRRCCAPRSRAVAQHSVAKHSRCYASPGLALPLLGLSRPRRSVARRRKSSPSATEPLLCSAHLSRA